MQFDPFCPSKTRFAVGTFDGYVRVYDIVGGNPIESISISAVPSSILFKDKKSVIVGTMNGICRLFIYEGQYG